MSSAEAADHTPAQWRSLVRGHWGGVEIRNHWRRDAVRGEDRSRTRHPGLLASLALLRNPRLALLPEHFPVFPTRRSTDNSTPLPPPTCASAAPPESMLALKKKDHARRAAA